ncbi:monoamine oxidase [Bosea sp. BK604]|nr:monoamine oxidase [Bosea sp. BK604]
MMADYDVIVIGAGAAGIAAARELMAAGLSIHVLEANDRIGGRAWTVQREGLPIDLGCGWLHSADRNPWTGLAETLGFAVDRSAPPWGKAFVESGFPAGDQRAARASRAAFETRLHDAHAASDRASDLLRPDDQWVPFIEATSTYVNGVELEGLSIRDYLSYADADTGVNWRVVGGYGALISAAAAALPVTLGVAATAIEADGRLLSVTTTAGTLAASRVVVTLSTSVLSSGALRLPSALDDRLEAAAQLPLGLADKIYFHLELPGGLDLDVQALGNPHVARTGSYHIRPLGRPLIEGFLGGAVARELEAGDEMAAFAVDELAGLFGADIKRRLRLIAHSRWGSEPLSGGSYSHALPGHAGARSVLATPWQDRIYFAGEACSESDFSTAHGAYATGIAAARTILASSGKEAGADPGL